MPFIVPYDPQPESGWRWESVGRHGEARGGPHSRLVTGPQCVLMMVPRPRWGAWGREWGQEQAGGKKALGVWGEELGSS